MSVLALLVPVVIALIAAFVRAAIVGDWVLRSLVGHFAFAILILPAVIHS